LAARSTAFFAAMSHDWGLVPMISMTLYKLSDIVSSLAARQTREPPGRWPG
jgi:hypothetical protein